MILVARSSNRRNEERRRHLAIAAVVAAAGFYASTLHSGHLGLALITLSVGTAGVLSMMPVFWTYPSTVLTGTAAAAGIAMINSIGNLAGFVSPSIIGWMKDVTHSTNAGLVAVAVALLLGGADDDAARRRGIGVRCGVETASRVKPPCPIPLEPDFPSILRSGHSSPRSARSSARATS